MKELVIEDLLYFSVYGLRQICSHNRDILYSFNTLSRIQLIELIQTRIKENRRILIPPFIYTDDKYLLSQYKVM